MDSQQTRSPRRPGSFFPPLPFEGARIHRERITKQDIEKGTFRSLQRERELKDASESLQGAIMLDRKNEVVNEALAEEVRTAAQRRRRIDDAAATVPQPGATTPAARDPKESPVEPDPDPKRRLLMKSAPSAASYSGQRQG